jgi:hypothetical protein
VLGRGDEVAGLDRRRRGHLAEVVQRAHVAQVDAGSKLGLHAGSVPVAAAGVEVSVRAPCRRLQVPALAEI